MGIKESNIDISQRIEQQKQLLQRHICDFVVVDMPTSLINISKDAYYDVHLDSYSEDVTFVTSRGNISPISHIDTNGVPCSMLQESNSCLPHINISQRFSVPSVGLSYEAKLQATLKSIRLSSSLVSALKYMINLNEVNDFYVSVLSTASSLLPKLIKGLNSYANRRLAYLLVEADNNYKKNKATLDASVDNLSAQNTHFKWLIQKQKDFYLIDVSSSKTVRLNSRLSFKVKLSLSARQTLIVGSPQLHINISLVNNPADDSDQVMRALLNLSASNINSIYRAHSLDALLKCD